MTDASTPPPAAPEVPVTGPAVEEPTSGGLSRLWGIFVSPSTTFEQNARRPNWLLPMIGWMVLAAIMISAIGSMVDQVEFTKNQIRNSPFASQMTEEQINQAAERASTSTFATVGRYLNPLLGPPIMLFLTGTLLWVLLLILGTDIRYMGVVSVLSHSFFVYALITSVLIVAVFYFAEDPNTIDMATAVSSNLGVLVDSDEQPVMHRLLVSFDIILLYFIFLVGLGLSKMSRKVSLAVGMVSITLLYGVYVGLVLVFTALFG